MRPAGIGMSGGPFGDDLAALQRNEHVAMRLFEKLLPAQFGVADRHHATCEGAITRRRGFRTFEATVDMRRRHDLARVLECKTAERV